VRESMKRPLISIILPTYNERNNVLLVIKEIIKALKDYSHEIIVVDDNSPDLTWRYVQEARIRGVTVIRRMKNKGLVNSLNEGIKNSKGNLIGWMDCDLSHPPYLLSKMVPSLLKSKSVGVVVASRFCSEGECLTTISRLIFSRILNFFAQLLLNWKLTDFTTGYVLARRELFSKRILIGNYGEYCIDFLFYVTRLGYRIIEIPYSYKLRRFGVTKTSPRFSSYISLGLSYGFTVLKLRLIGSW